MVKAPKNLREFDGLLKVVEFLRGPDGCPWDKEQTHQTLTRYALEETYEYCEAVDRREDRLMCEELGDMLLQVVLNAEIARQDRRFDISDVIEGIAGKMVRRHPHVFGDVQVKDSSEVLKNWAALKEREKGAQGKKALFDIPVALPALLRAQKIGEKTRKVDFDWSDASACWPKIREEIGELEEAMRSGSRSEMAAELGDVLFSLAQLARHLDLDSESALRECNQRFTTRFARMQELVAQDGLEWSSLAADLKEKYWKKAKA